jgi:hypothetical protein
MNRTRNKDGRWRKKRSDAGKPRKRKKGEERHIVLTGDEFMKEIREGKIKMGDIIYWDDMPFSLAKQDTRDQIVLDAVTLFESYQEKMASIEMSWTSSYTAFKQLHAQTVFLVGLVSIIKRIEALGVNDF